MTDCPEIQSSVSKAHQVDLTIDETLLPELIHGQLDKLQELDTSVKEALGAAAQAEKDAAAAKELSAGRGFWHDKKKEAIEALQESGVKLAEAVQVSAKTQKVSFEFQSRLAEVAKYLFSLGVRSIAANRIVVRELEMRLSGASEEELSELARQEVILLIQQLKAQEDLLRKQDHMKQLLGEHDAKIEQVRAQGEEQDHIVKEQRQEIAVLRQQLVAQQTCLETLTNALSSAEQLLGEHNAKIEQVHAQGEAQDRIVKEQRQEIAVLRQQLVAQQTRLETLTNALSSAGLHSEESIARARWDLNLRTVMLGIWATALPAVLYFWR
ncbi:hypothetical protein [Chromobacterium violaceum]|uniref:hypothetical protein n=1 Tax=Chromobacterium violaceum TaxID=536 RepID=UPI0005BB8E77|nr:hypothetical protein [Chromobacterium violaceum]